ncbi:hypothetical protein CYMTET_20916 [Cymbomonas tetramitiformis]|uniref:Uncharacterized protein n=1 Tax=Cymbomonas tetramitiformis TaxID=36881 RepID=A0AAE0G351_9CHLO|nr:hypothetical protein CYMTET_20916 [Cymbomonas tetramitiformis]
MEVLEGVVEECARGEARVKQAVDLSLFGSLIFMAWMGEQPRWWMRKFVPWWKAMSAGEMRDWFVEGERYGTYVLGSVLTRGTCVGKFWSGKRERLTKHFECVLQTDKAGGKKLYGGLRAKGYNGGSLEQALRRLSKKERFVEGCWEVDYTAGGWSFSDWAKLKLRYGRSRVQLSSGTQELRGTLREMLPSLQRENAKLRFSTIEITWDRFVTLLQRLDAFSTACEHAKQPLEDLFLQTIRRVFAWSGCVTQDNWITPYPKQDSLRFCFSLKLELFASILDFNLKSSIFCTPYPEDRVFGTIDNSYRFLWHFCSLGNPVYTNAHIRRCIAHALLSAKTTRLPSRTVLIVPHGPGWGKWEEQEGVNLVCLLQKNKFAFLAPQSALGFKDRSKAARFDVSILLIQDRAAARLRPVTRQGLARVERSFGAAVDDRGVQYSAEWGVGFSWQLARETRQWVQSMSAEKRVLTKFEGLMKCDMTAGMVFQKAGGELMRAVSVEQQTQSTCQIPALGEYRQLVGELGSLARGVLDRNTAVGFGVCGKIYQRWLREERDGGNYVRGLSGNWLRWLRRCNRSTGGRSWGLWLTLMWVGTSGTYIYLMLKHKDASLWEKRRPVVPGFAAPDRLLQNRIGRCLCFLITEIPGHFNVATTQEIGEKLAEFNSEVRPGDCVMAAGLILPC